MNIRIDINVCRVCLQPSDTTLNLFEGDTLEKFLFTTLVQVERNDGLPELLCQKCYGRLRIAYDFKKQTEESDKHIRSFIQDVNNKFKQVTKIESKIDNDLENDIHVYDFNNESTTTSDTFNTQQIGKSTKGRLQVRKSSSMMSSTSTSHVNLVTQRTLVEILENNSQGNDPEPSIEELLEVSHQLDVDPSGREVVIVDEQGIELIDHYKMDEDHGSDLIEYNNQDEYIISDLNQVDDETEETEENEDTAPESVEELFFEDEEHLDEDVNLVYVEPERRRVKNKDGIALHYCIKCNKGFSTRTNLTRHFLTHDGQKPYTCKICGTSFTQNGSLKSHMFIHTGERPYKCHVCPKAFTQSKSLTFHLRRHTGEKPFDCEECGMRFRQKDGLKRHEATKHSAEPPGEFPCKVCGKVLLSKYSLKLHTNKHSDKANNHKCNVCEKSFTTKQILNNHKKTHFTGSTSEKESGSESPADISNTLNKDAKPHICKTCNKVFTEQSVYIKHIDTHQPKNFKCSVCNKSFTIKNNFISHMVNHNIEVVNIFKCNDCNIGFDSQRSLKLHRTHHHKEKLKNLNECDICQLKFVSAMDLNAHIQETHDCIDIKCDYCNQQFFSKKLYEAHSMEHELNIIQDDDEEESQS